MKFKKWCVEHNYTAKLVYEITGIPVRAIYSYWDGTRRPTRDREKVMIEKLGIPSGLFD